MEWLDDLVNVGLLLGGVLLYSTQRDRPEYLWLCLWVLTGMPTVTLSILSVFHTFPSSWHILDGAGLFWPYCLARMYCAFVGHRIGWRLNLYLGATCVGLFPQFLGNLLSLSSWSWTAIGLVPLALLTLVVLPTIMYTHVHHGNRAEGILILPLMMNGIWSAANLCIAVIAPFPAVWKGSGDLAQFIRTLAPLINGFTVGPFYVSSANAVDIFSMLALALIILIRSNQMSREQAIVESELASAREIQQVVVPERVESIPGFSVESVYKPARQVGGDFFQVIPAAHDSLLLIFGDVAGKGLPAAMLVSVLVGAIRTVASYTRDPEKILAQLNERLLGRARGGFSTALAALITSDGTVTIANAGHLSPYLDGSEIALPGALPLGIAADASYESTRFHLKLGSRLTFYSDGVIEAQNGRGELFGFERGAAISTEPAVTIAEAAMRFGQSDDITVVAIQRLTDEGKESNPMSASALSPSTA